MAKFPISSSAPPPVAEPPVWKGQAATVKLGRPEGVVVSVPAGQAAHLRTEVLRTDPRSEPVMALSVSGDRDLPGLKELAESVFRRRLEQIDGVAQAAVTGGVEREIHVEVDPERLEALGFTIADVAAATLSAHGVRLAIGSDAHSLGLPLRDRMELGVAVARRGWLEPGDILNTNPRPVLK